MEGEGSGLQAALSSRHMVPGDGCGWAGGGIPNYACGLGVCCGAKLLECRWCSGQDADGPPSLGCSAAETDHMLTLCLPQILLGSGAHLSRYLVQLAMHHYFRTQVTFIKARWVRTLTFPVFAHFLSIAARMYGNIPAGKNEDDGSILNLYLKQTRFPTEYRAASWEQVRDVVEKYKVCEERSQEFSAILIAHTAAVHSFFGQGAPQSSA